MVVAHLTTEVAQANEVEDGDEVGESVETARVSHLTRYLSHRHTWTEVGTAARAAVIATAAQTILPV